MNLQDQSYKQWLTELKGKIRSSQIKAAIAVNTELILFYWELGNMLSVKLAQSNWGDKVLENVSKDLQEEFPEMKGFSVSNLKTCKLFFEYFSSQLANGDENLKLVIGSQLVNQLRQDGKQYKENDQQIVQQLLLGFVTQIVAKIPWGHIKIIITKIKNISEAVFYIQKIKENNWSRDVLALQIKSKLHVRTGTAITNFTNTLPEQQSELARQTLKDPYIFDFLQLSEGYKEKDIENQLVNHIKKFLLELGKGFAFVGQQYHLEIAEKDYYLDLLFYHIRLKCYVVIELKNTAFIPEYAGKLNFYLSAVDTLLKQEDDNPTIGILLCRDKNNIEAEFALRDINKPMGVSEFQISGNLPENLKSNLPTIEEIEKEFNNLGK
jgi:predicted nuclease of restriction endonuclease-like (RecB) superfamily